MKSVQTLDQYKVLNLESPASVSVVIAVKDGEATIESTIQRLLKCDYPDFEVIVVNDRSVDRTEEIIQQLKQNNPRLKSLHIKELPVNWLGKVHALHQGIQLATGDYVLFMDADVLISDDVLKSTVNACERNKLDHLAVLPEIIPGDYFLNVMTTTSIFLFVLSAKPWLDLTKRPINATKGVGAFNFIKRSAFMNTEGFTWLKMEVADDVALAQLMVRNGGRSLFMRAGESKLELKWYEDFKALVLGLEKNIVGGFTNYRLDLLFIISFISLLVSIVPAIALSYYELPLVFYSGVCFVMSTLIFTSFICNKKMLKQSFITIFLFPIGISILGLILLRSAYICFKNGGIKWSGTLYPLKELKKGCRVKLGL